METTPAHRRAAAATLVALAALAAPSAGAAPPPVANIRHLSVAPAAPGTRVEIVLDRVVVPEIESTAGGLALELDATRPGYGIHGSVFSGGLVAEIRLASVGIPSRPRTRIELFIRGAVDHRVRADGARLLIDLVPEGLTWPSEPRPVATPRPIVDPPAAPPATPPDELPAPPASETVPEPIEESDLDVETPPRPAPALASEPVTPLDTGPGAPPLASVDLVPPAGAPAKLRELIPIAAEPVPKLVLPSPAPASPELESEPVRESAPRLRAIVEIPSEPVAPLPIPSATTAPAAIASETTDGAARPAMRVEVTPSPEMQAAVAPSTVETPEPTPTPPLAPSEAAPAPVLPDELARPDELVPPAELPRPLPQPAPPAPPGPATRVLALERLAPGVVRIAADGVLDFLTFRLENPERFVLELAGVVNSSPLDSLEIEEEILVSVRIAQYRRAPRPVTRVVFDLRTPSVPEIETTARGLVVRFVRAAPRIAATPAGPGAAPALSHAPR